MIPGWKGGCLPLESLLHSTLECFYNLSCLSILTEKNHKMIQTLDSNREKYPISTNVLTLLGNLFINEWNWTISYKNYTKKCAPLFCTYSYTHRNSFIQIVITLFGLAGGLSTGLNLFIEQIILRLLIWNMKRKLKRQIALNITDGSNVSRGILFHTNSLFLYSLESEIRTKKFSHSYKIGFYAFQYLFVSDQPSFSFFNSMFQPVRCQERSLGRANKTDCSSFAKTFFDFLHGKRIKIKVVLPREST